MLKRSWSTYKMLETPSLHVHTLQSSFHKNLGAISWSLTNVITMWQWHVKSLSVGFPKMSHDANEQQAGSYSHQTKGTVWPINFPHKHLRPQTSHAKAGDTVPNTVQQIKYVIEDIKVYWPHLLLLYREKTTNNLNISKTRAATWIFSQVFPRWIMWIPSTVRRNT